MLRRSARLERNSIGYQERWGKGAQAQRWLKKNVIGRSPSKVRSRASTHKALLGTGGRSAMKASGKGMHFSAQRVSATALKILKVLPTQMSSPGSGARGSCARSPRSCTNGNCGLKSTEWNDAAAAVETPAADTLSGSAADLPCSKQTGVRDSMMQVSGINSRQVNSATPRRSRNSPTSISPCWNPVVLLKKLPELESPVNVMSLGRMDSLEFCLRDSVDAAPSPSPATPQTLGEGVPAVAGCRQAGSCFDCSQFDAHYSGEICISERNEDKDAFSISNLTDGLVSAELETAASESVNDGDLGNMLEVCARMAEIHPESHEAATEQARAVAGSRTPHHGCRVPSQYQQAFGGTFAKTANTLLDEDEVAQAVRSLDVTQIQRSTDSPHADYCFLTAADLPHVDWRWTAEAPTHPRPLPPLVTEPDGKDRIEKQKGGRPRKDATLVTVGCAKRSKSQCCFKQTKKGSRGNPAKVARKERPQHMKSTTVTDRKMAERGSGQNNVKTGRSGMAQPRKTWAADRKGTGSKVRQSWVKVAENKLPNPPKGNATGGQSEEVVMAGNEMSKPRQRRMLDRKCAYCAFHTKDRVAKVEHDKMCHPHKCAFCQHRFCSQKVLDAHKAVCAMESFQQCSMCERSLLRARRKQHFHSLAHIQHVRVAREVAREIQCHGNIDTYLSSMTCDPMSGCQKCHPAWLSLEQGPWERSAEDDAAALTEGFKSFPFPMETSAIDSAQSFPQGPVSSSTASATRPAPSIRNIQRQTPILPSAGHQEVLVQESRTSPYHLQSQTSASNCNVADDPACLRGRGTCGVGPNQANLVSLDLVRLQGHIVSTCDLQNQAGASNQDTVHNSASFLGQIITASDVLNQTDSVMLDAVAGLPTPHQGRSITVCELPTRAAAIGDQVTCADQPPREHTLARSDLQSNPPRGNADTFVDLLELIDQCDLSAAGLPFDSIDALEIVGMGEEDGRYNFGDERSKAAAGQECTLEDLMPLEIRKVPDINHTVRDPATEPGDDTGKELAAAHAHPAVDSWSQTSSYSPGTCMTTCSASPSLADLAGQGGAKPLFSMSSQLSTHHCTTDSADFSVAEPFAGDGEVEGENGMGAFPAELPGNRGSVSIALPSNTAQAVRSAQDKIDLENSFDPGSSVSGGCEERDLSKREQNDPRSLGVNPENSVISVSDSASRMPVDLARCDNTDRLRQNCVATPQDVGSFASEGHKFSLIHDHAYHGDPSTGRPHSTGGGFGSVDAAVGSRPPRLTSGQLGSEDHLVPPETFDKRPAFKIPSGIPSFCRSQADATSVSSNTSNCLSDVTVGPTDTSNCLSDVTVGPTDTSNCLSDVTVGPTDTSNCLSDVTVGPTDTSNCLSDVMDGPTDTSNSLSDVTVGPTDTSNCLSDMTVGPTDTSNSLSDVTVGPTDTSNSLSDVTVGPTDTSNSLSDVTVGPTDTSNSMSDVTICSTDTSNCLSDVMDGPTDTSNSLSDVMDGPTDTSNCLSDVMDGPTDTSNCLSDVMDGPTGTSNSLSDVMDGPTGTSNSLSDVMDGPTGTSNCLSDVMDGPTDTSNCLSDVMDGPTDTSNSVSDVTVGPTGTSNCLSDVTICSTDTRNCLSAVTHGPSPTSSSLSDVMDGPADTSNSLPGVTTGPTDTSNSQSDVISTPDTSNSLSDLSAVSAFSNNQSSHTPTPDTSNSLSDLSPVSAFSNNQSSHTPTPDTSNSLSDLSAVSAFSNNQSSHTPTPGTSNSLSDLSAVSAFSNNQSSHTPTPGTSNSLLDVTHGPTPTSESQSDLSGVSAFSNCWSGGTSTPDTSNHPSDLSAVSAFRNSQSGGPPVPSPFDASRNSPPSTNTSRSASRPSGIKTASATAHATANELTAKPASTNGMLAAQEATEDLPATNRATWTSATTMSQEIWNPLTMSQRTGNTPLAEEAAMKIQRADQKPPNSRKRPVTENISVTRSLAGRTLKSVRGAADAPVVEHAGVKSSSTKSAVVRHMHKAVKGGTAENLLTNRQACSHASVKRPARRTPFGNSAGNISLPAEMAEPPEAAGKGEFRAFKKEMDDISVTGLPWAVRSLDAQSSPPNEPAEAVTAPVNQVFVGPQAKSVQEVDSSEKQAEESMLAAAHEPISGLLLIRPAAKNTPAVMTTSTVRSAAVATSTAVTTSTVGATAGAISTVSPATVTTSTVRPTAVTSSTVRPTEVAKSTVRPTAVTSSTVRPTEVAKSTVRPTAVTSSTFRPTAVTTSTVRLTAVTLSTVRPTAVTTSTVRLTAVTSSTVGPTAVTKSTVRPTAVTLSTVRPTAVTSSAFRPAAVTSSTVRPTAVTASTIRPAEVTSSTFRQTAVTKSTVRPAAMTSSTFRPAEVAKSVVRPTAVVTSTVEPTASTVGSAAMTTSTVRSMTVRTTSNNGTATSASTAEPSRTKTPTGEQVTESTPTVTWAAASSAATKKVVASNPTPRQSSTVTKSHAKQASRTGTVRSMPASTPGGMNSPDARERSAAWRESSIHQQPGNTLAAEQGARQDTQQVVENTACARPFTAVKRSAVARSLRFSEQPAKASAVKRAASGLSGPARSSRVVGEAAHDTLKCSVPVPPKGWAASKTAEAHTDASCASGSSHACPPLPPARTACVKPPCRLPTAPASRSEDLGAAFSTHCSSQTMSAWLRNVMATARAYRQMEDAGMQYRDQTAADGTFPQREEGNLLGVRQGGRGIFPAGRAVSIHGRIQTVPEHWYNLQMGHRTWRETLLTPGIQVAAAVSCATQRFACSQDTGRALATSNTGDKMNKFGRNGEATVLTPANQQPRVSPADANQRQADWCSPEQAVKQHQQQVAMNSRYQHCNQSFDSVSRYQHCNQSFDSVSRYQHCNQSFDSVSRYQHCNQSSDSVVPAVPPKRPKLCRRAAGGYSDVSPRWQWSAAKVEKRYEDFWTPSRPISPRLMSASDRSMLTASVHSPDASYTSSVPHVPEEAHHADSGKDTASDRHWTFCYQRADSCFKGGRRHSGKLWTWAPSDGLPGK